MKNLTALNKYRVNFFGQYGDEHNGAFKIKIKGEEYFIIAGNGDGWDHVSIHNIKSPHKIPSWAVMCELKDMFFNEDETVMELHPAKSSYVNNHDGCLHLWKPQRGGIPLPPKEFV